MSQPMTPPSGGETYGDGPHRVLFVEDDPITFTMVRQKLVGDGSFTVERFQSAEAGLRAARENRYAAAVLDVGLPDGEGWEILQALKAPEVPRTPVLMLTARGAPGDVRKAVGLGADGFLVKPFSPNDLLSRLRSAVGLD